MVHVEIEFIYIAIYDEGTDYEAKVSGKIYAPDKGLARQWAIEMHPLANRIYIR